MSSIGQGSISIDDSTRIGENAQDTANKVAGNVNDINSDNKLTPTEKLKLKQEYDKDVELYNIDIEQLKSVNLPTAELETAMSNLTDFVTPLFKEMNRTSAVDRNTLDNVFTSFATADKNASQAFVNMVQQVADDAKKAGSDAKEAGEKAQEAGEEAKASADQAKVDATQAKADAATAQNKAQSSIDQLNAATTKFDGEIADAKNSAQQALDNITVVDSKVTNLSTSTTAQFNTLNNGYQEVISTVNNMDIGATNLLKNSKFDDKMNGWRNWCPQGMGTSTVEINPTGGGGDWPRQAIYLAKIVNTEADKNNQFGIAQDNVPVEPSTEYVLQLFNDGSAPITVQHGSGTGDPFVSQVVSDHKAVWKFKTPADIYNTNIYIGFNSGQSGTAWISLTKLEKGNKATDWSPAPEDLASQTQITTLNNLIDQKVSNDQYQSDKTQTADLISQTVKDVSGLKTEVSQVSDDVQILATTGGQKNLVYNSSYANNAEGWDLMGIGYLSTVPASSFNGSPGLGISVSDKKETDFTMFAKSKPYKLPSTSPYETDTNNVYSAQAKIKLYGESKVGSEIIACLSYLDANGSRISGWKDMAVKCDGKNYNQWITVKFENYGVPKNAVYVAFHYWGYGNVHGMIVEPMIVFGPKIGQYQPDVVNSSELDVSINGIQTTVTNGLKDLTTKVSQTDSAWRASVSTLGTTNMVYNGGFAHGVDGWNTENGKWTWSNRVQDQVQGSNAIQANFTGLTTDTWNNAASRPFLVRPGQKMSIGAIVTPWVLDSEPRKGFGLGLEFFASTDGTGTRNSYHPEQWVYTTGQQQLKVENITVPDGVNSAVVRLFIQRNGGANFTRVQANMTPTLPQFIDGFATATDITASINNINLKVSNSDGSSSQVNINNDTILLDANKIIFNGNTSIQNGTIGTAKIANAAINTAQIADGAINNAKIANAAINDAKISNLNGNKIVAGSITANKINVNDLIANGINTKTLTSVSLNTSTLTTPQLNLGLNGTFTEDFDYTQATSMFLPKKNKGTLTFNHGVLQSKGRMQTYTGNQWGGMNDNYTFQAGIDNSQWTEVAPGYIKLDLFKQNDADVGQRTYIDPTGYYYTSRNGIATYLGNVLQVSQVQTPSVFAKYIGPSNGELRLQIGSNGNDYGLQVGSYGGGEAVLSDFIYNTTSSHSPDVHITENGRLVRSTSASKYKYNIKNPDIETTLGDRLLNVHLATWNDKRAVDSYAEQLSTGEEREKSSIDEYYGLIAEQLRDAGLDMFISYGKNHEIEGIQYDRAWVPLLSVIRRLNDKVNEYELRLSKLEGANK
ncbi:hypothetical protein PGA94_09445 [Pediococcus pentosaceus]|uniref:hypothetical protein n=1 Tax=Pediococcus pentosaceus TaxID=1255 RepID=UPI00232B11C5|nr:hypothetical protein [Pediococcus pentosaceus]MDB1562997.1 hypothetical protein [Pediococcus pentosaceus]